jgi:hypothetical protein
VNTVTVTIREWGTCCDSGNIPHKLEDFFAALNEARLSIPAEYRDGARVDCEPEYEHGESYGCVRVTYERPMTPTEIEARRLENRKHWNGQWNAAIERAVYCEAELRKVDALEGGAA